MGSLRRQRQFFKAQGLRSLSLAGLCGSGVLLRQRLPLVTPPSRAGERGAKGGLLEVREWLGGTVTGPENCHGADRLSVGIAQKEEPHGKTYDCPIPAQHRDVGRRILVLRLAVGDGGAEALPVALAVVRRHDQVKGLANGRLGVMAEQALGARAEE